MTGQVASGAVPPSQVNRRMSPPDSPGLQMSVEKRPLGLGSGLAAGGIVPETRNVAAAAVTVLGPAAPVTGSANAMKSVHRRKSLTTSVGRLGSGRRCPVIFLSARLPDSPSPCHRRIHSAFPSRGMYDCVTLIRRVAYVAHTAIDVLHFFFRNDATSGVCRHRKLPSVVCVRSFPVLCLASC